MEKPAYKIALIVGAGEGLSASLARLFARENIKVALAARKIEKLGALCQETGARAFACNATEPDEVERLFGLVEREIGTPDIVVYNASARGARRLRRSRSGGRRAGDRGERVRRFPGSATGGPADAAQQARRDPVHRCVRQRKGLSAIGAVRDGEFALRGLAQSMARELSPQGIHIAHFVIDGGIRSEARTEAPDRPDSMLDPDAIAESYWDVLKQPRSAWSWELDCGPGSRNFESRHVSNIAVIAMTIGRYGT